MIDELDRKRLRDGLAGHPDRVVLEVHPAPQSDRAPANQKLAELAREFEVAAGGGLTVRPGDGRGLPALPALGLRVGDRANLRYLALPEGRESAPFIDALVGLASGQPPQGGWVDSLRALPRPVDLLVFIAGACAHCPQAVRAASQLAMASERVTVPWGE